MNYLEQLIELCIAYEPGADKVSRQEVEDIILALLVKKRLFWHEEDGKIVGYCESWRLNYEQLGRLLCGVHFSPIHEDINSGNIAYVANVVIHPNYRKTSVLKILKSKFVELNNMCEHFVGHAIRKKHQPFKAFKRHEIQGVIING